MDEKTRKIREKLKFIVEEYGRSCLKAESAKRLTAFLADFLPGWEFEEERKILAKMCAEGKLEGIDPEKFSLEEASGVKICPNCRRENPIDSVFCDGCGTRLEADLPRCPSCGKTARKDAKFCPVCGTSLSAKPAAKQKPAPANPQPTKSANPSVEMVLVEGGDTKIQGEDVTLDSFYMAKTQVNQELYKSVMGKNPSKFRGKNLPVECVSWYDAVEFCNALSKRDGLTPCYSGKGDNTKCDFSANGYRLPTEAEWEYAADGGRNENGYKYAGSDYVDNVAWFDRNSGNHTHPVAQKKPNSLGIYDMSGNVWEWCWDWYFGNFTGGDNPVGASAGDFRVLRGGSWHHFSGDAAVCNRSYDTPVDRSGSLGFRLARSA